MDTVSLSPDEVGRRAKDLYESKIRFAVETEANIGKLVIIDVETGDYAFDKKGLDSAATLRAKNPHARLGAIRIGYDVAAAFGAMMERIER